MCVIRYNISNNRRFVDINQNHSIEFQKKIVFLYPEEDSPPEDSQQSIRRKNFVLSLQMPLDSLPLGPESF